MKKGGRSLFLLMSSLFFRCLSFSSYIITPFMDILLYMYMVGVAVLFVIRNFIECTYVEKRALMPILSFFCGRLAPDFVSVSAWRTSKPS